MNSFACLAQTSPHLLSQVHPPRLLRLLGAAISISMLILAALLLSACRTTSPLDVSAKTLASTVQSVDAAMQGYATAVVLDLVKPDDQAKVRKLYEDYQAAVAVAETAITTAIKTGDAGSLAATSAALTAARDPLLAFLARIPRPPDARPQTQDPRPHTAK
jgi:hypothetical protein